MNFDNMTSPGAVLTSEYWPAFPGQEVIWVPTLIIYGAIMAFALHFEIFYGAS
jgi:hypothetical protein